MVLPVTNVKENRAPSPQTDVGRKIERGLGFERNQDGSSHHQSLELTDDGCMFGLPIELDFVTGKPVKGATSDEKFWKLSVAPCGPSYDYDLLCPTRSLVLPSPSSLSVLTRINPDPYYLVRF